MTSFVVPSSSGWCMTTWTPSQQKMCHALEKAGSELAEAEAKVEVYELVCSPENRYRLKAEAGFYALRQLSEARNAQVVAKERLTFLEEIAHHWGL